MPEQYVATDKRTGLEVSVTGDFPEHSDDRIRIARTTTLFTRLMATMLSNGSESERREQFQAIETQLEVAEALIRQDFEEVRQLMQKTLERMGISAEDLDEMVRRMLQEFGNADDLPPEVRKYAEERGMLGDQPASDPLQWDVPLDDVGIHDEQPPEATGTAPEAADAPGSQQQPEGESRRDEPRQPNAETDNGEDEGEDDDGPIPMGPASN